MEESQEVQNQKPDPCGPANVSKDGYWSWIKRVLLAATAIALAVIGLVGSYHAFNSFVDNKIDEAVADVDSRIQVAANSEEFIRKVRAGVRPFLVFDTKGTVLVDLGVLEYVDPPVVTSREGDLIPEKVLITPKSYMNHAPLITGIDQIGAVAHASRGEGLTWEYTFEATYVMAGDVDPESQVEKKSRYRLEIME